MTELKRALEPLEGVSGSGPRTAAAPPAPRGPRGLGLVGAWLLAAALGMGVGLGPLRRPAVSGSMKVSLLAAMEGMQTHPALSPDGRRVAFVWNGERQDNADIYVQRVGEAAAQRLTSAPEFDFSPV